MTFQYTPFHEHDGEVVLPQKLAFSWRFRLGLFDWNPLNTCRSD